jgi:hypothetical protein
VLTKNLFMKKNVFTLFAFFMMAGAASAQTEMGGWLIGGNLNLNTAKNNTVIGVTPSAGYFFADNFAAGANISLDYSKYEVSTGEGRSTTFGVGPFARYYFGSSNTRPLIHGSWNFISEKDKSTVFNPRTETTITRNGSQFFIGGGLAGFINRNVALEALAGYNHFKYRHAGEGSGGFLLRVGFQVYLSGSQMSRATGQ